MSKVKNLNEGLIFLFIFSGQPNWVWNSDKDPNFFEKDGLNTKSWYLVEIEQYFHDQGKSKYFDH